MNLLFLITVLFTVFFYSASVVQFVTSIVTETSLMISFFYNLVLT